MLPADQQIIDERAEGVYCRWDEYPDGFGVYGLILERVNGDGSVSSFQCTDDEAEVVRRFIEAPR